MKAFQAIADQNPGPDGHASRNSGEPGYKASVDYVANLMRQAGYDVTIQTYKFFYFAYTAIPTFREVSPTSHDYTVVTDWNPGQSTGTGTAAVQPAGGIIIPPTRRPARPAAARQVTSPASYPAASRWSSGVGATSASRSSMPRRRALRG
jgi:hypothetical protein